MTTPRRGTFDAPLRFAAAIVLALAFAIELASAQSLGDVARQEEARRKTVKSPGKVYTNDALKSEPGLPQATVPSPSAPQSGPKSGTPNASGQTPASGASATDAKQEEASWRKRVQAEREALERSQTFADALQSRINGLNADFTSRDDPAQRNVVAANRDKAIKELDRVKGEIQQHTKALADIQDEARRANVPAGWVR